MKHNIVEKVIFDTRTTVPRKKYGERCHQISQMNSLSGNMNA